ncbi:MAG: MazG family protein [Oscillospiraceae bacterium]|nr:MazG family protein [Oscillospiraceae bacterium]
MTKDKYTFDDLVEIVRKLRAPDGCPWDREQTHDSIKENTVEEVYEMLESFDSGDGAKMADESGDLLLHIVFHASIGEASGEYNIDDVTDAVCRKLILRHPHIFSDENFANSAEVLDNWDSIKRAERGQTSVTAEMKGISKYLPSLIRASKAQKKAAKSGFSVENRNFFEKYEKKVLHFCEINGITSEEGFSRMLFGMVSVANRLGIQPEIALNSEVDKFIAEFEEFENGKL